MLKELKAKLEIKTNLLQVAIANMDELGNRRAETEKQYRIALGKKMLEYRAEGYPVTIIGDMCRGDEEVATLKYHRDMAEALYKKNNETISATKHSIDLLTERLKSEFEKGA